MKKNSEYVGVDEKFVPEDEKYVNDSVLGSREESKKKLKKGLKVGLLIYLGIILLVIVIGIVAMISIFNFGKNSQKEILDLYDKTVDQMNNQMNNSSTDTLDEMKDVIGGMSDIMDGFMNSESNPVNKTTFNAMIERNSGMNYGMAVISLLDDVSLSNKKNSNHVITVVYKEINTSSEDEIINIKGSLDKFKEYNVSLDYDENGYINKVTIKDM